MNGTPLPPRFNRRAFALAGLGLLTIGGAGVRSALAQQPDVNLTGDCSDEPGVALLLDWRNVLLTMSQEEVLAPVGWQLFGDVNSSLVLLVPPDWKAQLGWASKFTSTGAPILESTPNPDAGFHVTRFLNADSTIAYESTFASIQGVALKPLEAANIAIQGILGETPDIQEICTVEADDGFMTSWTTAHRYRDSVLVTVGQVLANSDTFGAYSSVTYQSFYGPRKTYEKVVREYFIRFLYQQLSKGGSDEPTPTPTPEF